MKTEKNIEEIALKFLNFKETTFHHQPHQDSILTLKDLDLYGMNTSFPHSRQNSKLLSIVANNKVVGEYNINSFLVPKTKKVKLCQIPQKQLEEIEINCDIEDDSCLDVTISVNNNNNNISPKTSNDQTHIDYVSQLTSLIDFQIVYDGIKQFYSPLIDIINQTDDDGVALDNTNQSSFLMYIENYINVDNTTIFFCCDKRTNTKQIKGDESKLTSALNEFKLIELITLGYLIYSFQLNSIAMNDQFEEMNSNEHDEVTVMIRHCIYELYDDILLIILYYYNDWKDKENLSNHQKMCFALVQDNYKNQFKPSNDNIVNKLLESIETIKKMLRKISETVINYLYHIVQGINDNNNNNISTSNSKIAFNADFMDELTYFEKIIAYLKEEEFDEEGSTNCPNINTTNDNKVIKDKNSLSYTELVNDVQKLYEIYLNFQKNAEVKAPYLPEIDHSKYKYTLVVDLDETLVHYVEEEEKAYVQVRPYAEYFLSEMAKYFEIVIFTAASEDYANIVLQGLDKSNSVSHKLSRRHTNQENGVLLKDLSKLGRDISKICIIDNSKENFGLQPENGLNISSFLGDLNDDELLLLSNDLMQIHEENPNDIRNILQHIRKKMENRYKIKKTK